VTASGDRPRVLVVQHEPDTGPGWFGDWLTAAGLALDVQHPYAGDELPPLPAYDGLLVLGGAMAPADDVDCPWLPETRARLAEAVASGVPTFGICLGAELLALGCGGEVRRGTAGPELGVLAVDLAPAAADDAVFGALPGATRVVQWHWEEISTLPAGSVPLASSPAYPHQAFRVGVAAWGVQGHPEVTADIAAAWAREDSPLLMAEGRTPDDLVAEVRAAETELSGTWRPLAEAFAGVVRDFAASGSRPAPR
jgi:GMP synthase (glutamine-hydrolysing)